MVVKPHLPRWGTVALALVIVPLFAVLIWQLWGLSPERYCGIVRSQGVPPGNHCFQLLMEGLKIKGWVIWLLIGTLAVFVLMVLSSLVKAVVAVTGPHGLGIKITSNKDPEDDAA